MSIIYVGLIGTAQWCLENEEPEKKGKFGAKLKQMPFFAFKSSILVRFANFKNCHLQNYQTKLTICGKLICIS